MMIAYTRAALCAAPLVLAGLSTAACAVEIPIHIPGCPERDGTDRSKSESDVEGRRALDDQSVCGGGGAGGDAANAYQGVRSPAGGGGGGGGGGTSTQTLPSQTSAADLTAAQSSDSTGDVSQSTSGAGGGGTPTPQPTNNGSLIQTGNPTPNAVNSTTALGGIQTGEPTPNAVNSTAAPGGFGDNTFDGSSTSVGHVAPMPDLGGGLSWLIALIAAVFFYRRRLRV